MAIPPAAAETSDFQIETPAFGELLVPDSAGMLRVRVMNEGFDSFTASIFPINGTPGATTDLVQEGSSNLYSALVPAGSVPSSIPARNNKEVEVIGLDAGEERSIRQGFKAWSGGSGSGSGSGSRSVFAAAQFASSFKSQQRCAHCNPNQPVPVELLLKLDSKVEAGTCAKCNRLNQATVLRHSDDPQYPCSWFSEPIAFCGKGEEPGLWMLEKTNASTWTLTLRRGTNVVVTYSQKTKKKKDCTLPLKLDRVGKGGKECKKWAKTVTVEPAPLGPS